MHRHQLRKRKTRESCSGPLTTAKLTRSCVDPNAGAITYTQVTTDIVLEVNQRCKTLVLEHHKHDKMRASKAPNVGCHVKISGKDARDLSRGYLVCLYAGGCPNRSPWLFLSQNDSSWKGRPLQTHTRETHPKRTGKNGFTNFSEISYEKTRGSYDRSAIAARKQKVLLAHQSALTLGPMPTDPPSPPPANACYTSAAVQRTSTPRRERRHDNNRRS